MLTFCRPRIRTATTGYFPRVGQFEVLIAIWRAEIFSTLRGGLILTDMRWGAKSLAKAQCPKFPAQRLFANQLAKFFPEPGRSTASVGRSEPCFKEVERINVRYEIRGLIDV